MVVAAPILSIGKYKDVPAASIILPWSSNDFIKKAEMPDKPIANDIPKDEPKELEEEVLYETEEVFADEETVEDEGDYEGVIL